MSRCGLAVTLVSKRTWVRFCFGSLFSSKVLVYGHGYLVTLPLTINLMNETLTCLLLLPILINAKAS